MNKTHKSLIISGFVLLAVLVFSLYGASNAFAATVCSGGTCTYVACNSNSDCGTSKFNPWAYSCQNNNLYQDYITYICNNPGSAYSTCTTQKQPQIIQTCSSNQKCQIGLWYTGCASATDTNNTYYTNNNTNTNTTNTNNNTNTTTTTNTNTTYQNYSYQSCVGNSLYWFDSNGKQQSLYQTCGSNQVCSNNSCTAATAVSCTPHTIKGCINNSIYWYNSCGTQESVYQNCSATNQVCQDGACVMGTYYQPPMPVKTPAKTYIVKSTPVKNKSLVISIFGKKESDPLQWEKNISAINNDKIDFLITVKNTSNAPIEKVLVKVDITKDIDYTNDLKIDDVVSEEDIELGVDLGTIAQNTSKALLFTGVVKSEIVEGEVKITGNINSGNISDSDFFTIQISTPEPTATPLPSQVENKTNSSAAAIGSSSASSFFKTWYIWVVVAIALIFLFIIIFRKLSRNV